MESTHSRLSFRFFHKGGQKDYLNIKILGAHLHFDFYGGGGGDKRISRRGGGAKEPCIEYIV